MSRFEWDSSLTINHKKIDSQHKEFFRLYNNLHDSLLNDSLEDTVKTKTTTLNGLLEYIVHHFSTEKMFFEQINYPEAETHCQQHDVFTDKIERIREDVRLGRVVLTTQLMKLLRNWFVEHIAVEDRKYAQYYKEIKPK